MQVQSIDQYHLQFAKILMKNTISPASASVQNQKRSFDQTGSHGEQIPNVFAACSHLTSSHRPTDNLSLSLRYHLEDVFQHQAAAQSFNAPAI